MHPSSMENMYKCYQRYVDVHPDSSSPLSVVDIGGVDINGSYREIFSAEVFAYRSADTDPEQPADILLPSNYQLPLESNSVDFVLCGQTLEHCEFFWLLFDEMMRILRPTGMLFLIVPSAGPIHRFPVDCYRFYPDSLRAMAKHSQCHLIDHWRDTRGPWQDLVGVFSKTAMPAFSPTRTLTSKRFSSEYEQRQGLTQSWQPQEVINTQDSSQDRVAGAENYIETLQRIHRDLKPQLYLEIGVRLGKSLQLAKCAAIGIDPLPELTTPLDPNSRLFTMTSDDFFEFSAAEVLGQGTVDLAFIDGLHIFEFVLRDFLNVEKYATPSSVIIIDDVLPNSPEQAARVRQSRVWTGDVWKISVILKKYRPDLTLTLLDTHPTGLLVVLGLDPSNRVIEANYNQIVRFSSTLQIEDFAAEVLSRTNALDPRAFSLLSS